MTSYKIKIVGLILAVGILIVTAIAVQQQVSANGAPPEHQGQEQGEPAAKPAMSPRAMPPQLLPEVSVVWQQPAEYQAQVQAYGSIEPHFEVDLTAQIEGQIETVSPQFDSGYHVRAGDELVTLEDSEYVAALAEAKQNLAEAHVALLEEERQGKQALLEWQHSGLEGEPDSELVLRKPQLQAAQSRYEQAQSAVKYAQRNLDYTHVKAPFDGIVITRDVALGGYVQKGSAIATLHSTDRAEISLALSENDWQSLPDMTMLQGQRWPVTLSHVESQQTWQAYVLRAEQHLTDETRQRRLIVAVDNPFEQTPALYTGTFVSAQLLGQQRSNLWQLPSTALSPRGEIWYVDEDSLLAKFSATPVFSRDNNIFVYVPDALQDKRTAVLAKPLNSYLTGMKVKIMELDRE